MQLFSPTQQKILEALARFGYLTVDQLLHLGIGSERSYLNKMLYSLRTHFEKPLVYSNQFGVHPKRGRLPSVHCLSKQGANLLYQQLGWPMKFIRYTNTKQKLFQSDYDHRIGTISIHLAFYKRAIKKDYEIVHYYYYFDRGRQGPNKSTYSLASFPYTQNKRIIADSLVLLSKGNEKYVLAVEFYNDKNVSRILKQLGKYLLALSIGYPSLQFGVEKNARIVLVFKHKMVMKSVEEKVLTISSFTPFLSLLLFTPLEQFINGVPHKTQLFH